MGADTFQLNLTLTLHRLNHIKMAELQGDDALLQFPNLRLPQLIFSWEKEEQPASGLEGIMNIIDQNSMAHFYEACCAKYNWTKDDAKVAAMR